MKIILAVVTLCSLGAGGIYWASNQGPTLDEVCDHISKVSMKAAGADADPEAMRGVKSSCVISLAPHLAGCKQAGSAAGAMCKDLMVCMMNTTDPMGFVGCNQRLAEQAASQLGNMR